MLDFLGIPFPFVLYCLFWYSKKNPSSVFHGKQIFLKLAETKMKITDVLKYSGVLYTSAGGIVCFKLKSDEINNNKIGLLLCHSHIEIRFRLRLI